MQQIYTARNDMDAHFVQGLLEQAGIRSVIQGEAQEGAWGTLQITAKSALSVWIDESDAAAAQPVVDEFLKHRREDATGDDRADIPAGKTWRCVKCGELVEDQFDECWNCGAERPEPAVPDQPGRSSTSPTGA